MIRAWHINPRVFNRFELVAKINFWRVQTKKSTCIHVVQHQRSYPRESTCKIYNIYGLFFCLINFEVGVGKASGEGKQDPSNIFGVRLFAKDNETHN